MQNDFEKQVQQKMGELKLVPSQPVWEKVEMQIRKKKGRRRFIYLFFSVALLSAGLFYLLFTSDNHPAFIFKTRITNSTPASTIHPGNTFKTKTSVTEIGQPGESDKTAEGKIRVEKQSTGRDLIIINKRRNPSGKKINDHFSNRQNAGPDNNSGKPGLAFQKQGSTVPSASETSATSLKPSPNESLMAKDTASFDVTENNKAASKQQPADQADSLHADSLVHKTANRVSANRTSDSISKQKIRSNPKWHRIAGVELGWSQYKTGLFSNAYMSPLYNSAVSSGGPASYLYYPSEARKDFSFAMSAGLQKRFKSRVELSMSLQFHYYSARTMIGQLNVHDTSASYNAMSFAISRYYTNARQNNYTDRFGIIEVPVSVGYEPFKNLPLKFSIGASYGRLLKSNMLTFDYQSNFYYYNKDNNVKNFLSVFSALQYKIGRISKGQMTAGPVVQFNPTELQYYNRYNIPHLFFWGLRTEVSF